MHKMVFGSRLVAGLAGLSAVLATDPVGAVPDKQQKAAPPHAVIFTYHRFGEDDVPLTNIRLPQFRQHLAFLKKHDFNVVPLKQVIEAFQARTPLPDRTVALTADDAYRSVMTDALPMLQEYGWSMTLFVATNAVDRKYRRFLSWDEIRRVQQAGIDIGAHGTAHAHLPDLKPEAQQAEITVGTDRLAEEIGQRPRLFAYPYGEYSLKTVDLVRKAGFAAAFGQHSGVAHGALDILRLPRFAMNEAYGGADRFKLAAKTLPLRVMDLAPLDPVLKKGSRPAIRFRVLDLSRPVGAINCFIAGEGSTAQRSIDGDTITLTPRNGFRPGRTRVNCTRAAGGGRFQWWGRQFYAR